LNNRIRLSQLILCAFDAFINTVWLSLERGCVLSSVSVKHSSSFRVCAGIDSAISDIIFFLQFLNLPDGFSTVIADFCFPAAGVQAAIVNVGLLLYNF
jgi:hypothetical protein